MIKKTTRTRAEAKKLMWEYYRENQELLPHWIRDYREDIIHSIQAGNLPDAAFSKILEPNPQHAAARESAKCSRLACQPIY